MALSNCRRRDLFPLDINTSFGCPIAGLGNGEYLCELALGIRVGLDMGETNVHFAPIADIQPWSVE